MRGINLLPSPTRSSGDVMARRRLLVTASIIVMIVASVASVAVFLVDLYVKGSVRQLQQKAVALEDEIRAKGGTEGLAIALKQRAETIVTLKKKQVNYQPVIDGFVQVIGRDGTLEDLSVDTKKLSASFSSQSSDGVVTILDRLQSEATLPKQLSNVVLVSLSSDGSTGWRASITADVM